MSAVSTWFDPLGLLAPITLEAKLILQTLTRLKVSWDDPIPASTLTEWTAWCNRLPAAEDLCIPRVYCPLRGAIGNDDLQLHVFSDASQRAYGACAYLRFSKEKSTLVMGKARVAPIKPTTMPRLEVTAAMVASRMRTQIEQQLQVKLKQVVMWTDSTIVLGYIRNTTTRFKAFVANRLVTIHEHTQPEEWRYVPTSMNPADLASRGFTTLDEPSAATWINGPSFLQRSQEEWPQDMTLPVGQEDPEIKTTVLVVQAQPYDVMLEFCTHFSSLDKAIHSVAWWIRYVSILRKKIKSSGSPLTIQETREAKALLLRAAQLRHFAEDLKQLTVGQVKTSSHLVSLCPVMHGNLMKTGSRLRFSPSHPPTTRGAGWPSG